MGTIVTDKLFIKASPLLNSAKFWSKNFPQKFGLY